MTNTMDWQGATGRNWADEWRRTDRSFSELTTRLIDRIASIPGETVLDIGCGAGELTLAVATARPSATVLGVDISPELVEAATARSSLANVRFALANAAAWAEAGFVPDLVVSRHGVMFFEDPPAAFAHIADVSAPGARLVFSCFRSPALNAWASEIGKLVAMPGAAPADPHAPGPFAFADPERVSAVLESGWSELSFEDVDFTYIAGEGADPVGDAMAFFSRIGPFAAAMRERPESEQADLRAALRALAERHSDGMRVAFPAAAWIVSARKR